MHTARVLSAIVALVSFAMPGTSWAMKPYMWGVGGRLGTIVFPSQYPVLFPPAVEDDNTGIEKTRGDVIFGGEGYYWANPNSRFNLTAGLGSGSGYHDMHLLVGYDQITHLQGLDYFLGGGAGLGKSVWTGQDEAKLEVPNFPLRVQAGLHWHQTKVAIEGLVFAQYNLPSAHYLTGRNGNDLEVGTGVYIQAGLELRVLYGSFEKVGKGTRAAKGKKGHKNRK
jgi:hypothetical protein